MTATTSTNGAETTAKIVTLPSTISVVVAGATITAHAEKAASGNIWFQAKHEKALPSDGRSPEEILVGIAGRVTQDGEPMQLGSKYLTNGIVTVVHDAPSVNKKTGRVMSKGGRPTLVFVKPLQFGELSYTLIATCKVHTLASGPVLRTTVQAQLKPQPTGRPFTSKGDIEGDMEL